MARQCPECRSVINDDRLGRCAACGCRLTGEKHHQRWETHIGLYIAGLVAMGLIAAGAWYWYALHAPGG